jgi:hypothetical protein
MASYIRGGVPREVNIDGEDYDPAEGAQINFMLSGRSGAVHIAGNEEIYQESNPHLGGFNQDISCDDDKFATLSAAQSNGSKISGYFITASNQAYTFTGGISNDGPLELDNGVVSLEVRGKVESQ